MKTISNKKSQLIDVIGIGNAIVDVLVYAKDSFIESNSLKKGNMCLINEEHAEKLYSQIIPNLETSGGSAANTLAGIAQLGGKSAFIGRVKNDNLGKIFTQEIRSSGSFFETSPTNEGPNTARCIIFVTPDAQRTMCTYLGASSYLEPDDLDFSLIRRSKVLYLEGYLFDSPPAKRAFIKASEISKLSGGEVALSLSDSFCVNRHREEFKNLIENYIDILFANESEIKSLYESSSLENAISRIKGCCKIAVITCGSNGSIIITKEKNININPYSLGEVIDTTGAGDLYASGFLYGYVKNKDLETSGSIGSICAGQIITQLGSRSETSLLEIVNKNIILL
tara:strand:+ start:1457 stop:2473 length:1017 start_codon:yes stop_codon:yes gene_type:complete